MKQNALLGRTVADRFTVKGFLGEGGMATVYVAEQAAEPHEIALKIMNRELTRDRTFVKRFQREAKAAMKVHHPNSVQIFDYGVTDDGLSYMAMELIAGDDLYVLLERDGALTQQRAARILIEVCEALTVAHDLGIVHRDLKPENIMVVPDADHPDGERVKVLDFGIAKTLVSDAMTNRGIDPRADPNSYVTEVTRAGTFIGTPAYMSPEQCSLLPVDTRADIYTCGVLLYQLVTGKLPFEGETPLHTATLHIHKRAPHPSEICPAIDPRLEAVILKALSKKPVDRQQTAHHLGVTLNRLLPDLPDTVVAVGPATRRPASSYPRPPPRAATLEPRTPPRPGPAAGAPLGSAKTLIAHGGLGGPLPQMMLRAGPPPSTPEGAEALERAQRPPDSDEGNESARTLVRSVEDLEADVPADTRRTLVIEIPAGGLPPMEPQQRAGRRSFKPTLPSANEFQLATARTVPAPVATIEPPPEMMAAVPPAEPPTPAPGPLPAGLLAPVEDVDVEVDVSFAPAPVAPSATLAPPSSDVPVTPLVLASSAATVHAPMPAQQAWSRDAAEPDSSDQATGAPSTAHAPPLVAPAVSVVAHARSVSPVVSGPPPAAVVLNLPAAPFEAPPLPAQGQPMALVGRGTMPMAVRAPAALPDSRGPHGPGGFTRTELMPRGIPTTAPGTELSPYMRPSTPASQPPPPAMPPGLPPPGLSGTKGLLIAFLGGMVMMALFAIAYTFLMRPR